MCSYTWSNITLFNYKLFHNIVRLDITSSTSQLTKAHFCQDIYHWEDLSWVIEARKCISIFLVHYSALLYSVTFFKFFKLCIQIGKWNLFHSSVYLSTITSISCATSYIRLCLYLAMSVWISSKAFSKVSHHNLVAKLSSNWSWVSCICKCCQW